MFVENTSQKFLFYEPEKTFFNHWLSQKFKKSFLKCFNFFKLLILFLHPYKKSNLIKITREGIDTGRKIRLKNIVFNNNKVNSLKSSFMVYEFKINANLRKKKSILNKNTTRNKGPSENAFWPKIQA